MLRLVSISICSLVTGIEAFSYRVLKFSPKKQLAFFLNFD